MTRKLWVKGVIISITFLFLSTGIIPLTPLASANIIWDVTINFSETGGAFDYTVFGECTDANDGPPADSYDVAKPPAPMPPYIRAYFKDNLPTPYTNLWKDYRHYPATQKTWNLTIQWVPEDGESPTTITMTWNPTSVAQSEYSTVNLCTDSGTILQNMLTTNTYTFNSQANVLQKFKIICSVTANHPPVIGTPTPANGSVDNPLSFTWGIPVNDPDGDPFSWTLQCNNGQVNSGTGELNGTKSLLLSGLLSSTTYKVWINATDPQGSGEWIRKWYTFSTQPSGTETLDQQQTQFNTNYAVYLARWGGQSFIPTLGSLTSVQLYLRKTGSPPGDIILSIRSSLTGADLVSLSKPATQISTSIAWVTFDISDIPVTAGNTYYLVLRTTEGSSSNCYSWGYGSGTPYSNGVLSYSYNSGGSWTSTTYDFCFKTYGASAPATPTLSFSPSSYNFGNILQGSTGSTSFEIWNSGTGILTYSLSESVGWASVTPGGGSSSSEHDTIIVNIDTSGLTPGSFTCPISISSNGGSGTFTVYVTVIEQSTEQVDQQQTQYNTNYAVYLARWGGQSFIPTLGSLTSVQLYLRKTGNPPADIVFSVRSSLTGSDLVSLSKPASQIPTNIGWLTFDFNDLTLTPGNTYYLVLRTSGGDTSNCYQWVYGSNTPYTNGALSTSYNTGSSWTQYIQYDFSFKTYGHN
jgi:hypothetical protein